MPSDGYNTGMASHSIAEAKDRLPELIDLALKGEEVVITQHGRPMVELKAITASVRPISPEALDWLAAHRVKPGTVPAEDAGTLLSRMRDEGEK
jgi:antitoxin (DNA-binding transcriptional repressor) of toxin-antitoxin stability system